MRRRPSAPALPGALIGLEDNFHSAPWTEAARGYLRAKWPDQTMPKRTLPARWAGRFKSAKHRRSRCTSIGRAATEIPGRGNGQLHDRPPGVRRRRSGYAPIGPGRGRPSGWNWNLCRVRRGKATARGRQKSWTGWRSSPRPFRYLRPLRRAEVVEIPYKSERRMLHAGRRRACPFRRWAGMPELPKIVHGARAVLRLCEYCGKQHDLDHATRQRHAAGRHPRRPDGGKTLPDCGRDRHVAARGGAGGAGNRHSGGAGPVPPSPPSGSRPGWRRCRPAPDRARGAAGCVGDGAVTRIPKINTASTSPANRRSS